MSKAEKRISKLTDRVSELQNLLDIRDTQLENKYRKITLARSSGGYFIAKRIYSRFLPKIVSYFLSDLINRSEMIGTISEERVKLGKTSLYDEEGYFKCSVEFLSNKKYIPWSEDEQRRHIAHLVKVGILKTKRVGIPPARWILINPQKLAELERESSSENRNQEDDM